MHGQDTLAASGRRFGYLSEHAFDTAFKRVMGLLARTPRSCCESAEMSNVSQDGCRPD